MVSDAGTESYTLDALNRITAVSYPQGDTASYTYDPAGNRLTKTTTQGGTTTYTYDDADELLSDGTNAYSYDQNGNLLTAGSSAYTWDYANRLSTAHTGSTTTPYLWDRQADLPLLASDWVNGYFPDTSGSMAGWLQRDCELPQPKRVQEASIRPVLIMLAACRWRPGGGRACARGRGAPSTRRAAA